MTSHFKYSDTGNFARELEFFDMDGCELKGWVDSAGKTLGSVIGICSPAVDPTWRGKEVDIPIGYEICGFRAWADPDGAITWLDLKVWKCPFRK